MDKDIDYLLEQFSFLQNEYIKTILGSPALRLRMVFFFLCQLLIETDRDSITSTQLLDYIIMSLKERGIKAKKEGNLYSIEAIYFDFANLPKHPKSSPQQGKFNPNEWFSKAITDFKDKKFVDGFDERWLEFIDRSRDKKTKPYEYFLNPEKYQVVEQAILKNKEQSSGSASLTKIIKSDFNNEDTKILERVLLDLSLSKTEREAIVKSRIGQGKFRDDLKQYWDGRCAVTNLSITEILRASHIKPWRDSDNYERLDSFNGLLLAPNLDSLFDKFLISFDEQGKIMISPKITKESSELLGINAEMALRNIESNHQKYLIYHRHMFFDVR